MNITVFYASGRAARSCTGGIAQLLIGELLDGGQLFSFQLPRDMPHVCTGCGACLMGREQCCGGVAALAPIRAAMEQSELLVFCAPTYAFHAPGQLKTFLDHFAFRWMVHRPALSMMNKQAVIINTAGGGGMRRTARDVRDSMEQWGVARTHVLAQKVWQYDWTTLPASFRASAEAKVRRTAAAVRRGAGQLTPSVRVKALFYLYRLLHKRRKLTPVDDEYWDGQGYLTGKPWRKPCPR